MCGISRGHNSAVCPWHTADVCWPDPVTEPEITAGGGTCSVNQLLRHCDERFERPGAGGGVRGTNPNCKHVNHERNILHCDGAMCASVCTGVVCVCVCLCVSVCVCVCVCGGVTSFVPRVAGSPWRFTRVCTGTKPISGQFPACSQKQEFAAVTFSM